MQIKDVEAAIQETVADQLHELGLSYICAASTTDFKQSLTENGWKAMSATCGLLTAIADPGLNSCICLSQAFARLTAKRCLKGGPVARGLQNIIVAAGNDSTDKVIFAFATRVYD